MLHPRAISRETIDRWPVQSAGFPIRVVNCARRAGIKTTGELRNQGPETLLSLRNMGGVSLEAIDHFFKMAEQLEKGQLSFSSFREILEAFLNEEERFVLISRFGLLYPRANIGKRHMTLQEIGNEKDLTRERVRQVEKTGGQRLQYKLAAHCLHPLLDLLNTRISEKGQAVSRRVLHADLGDPVFGGYNPVGVTMLLAELFPNRICGHQGFFSSLEKETLKSLSRMATNAAAQMEQPGTMETIAGKIPDDLFPRLKNPPQLVSVILRHEISVVTTNDHQFIASHAAFEHFLVNLLKEAGGKAHYRKLTDAFNARVKQYCRKGSGFILDKLKDSETIYRHESGYYSLERLPDKSREDGI